MASFATDPAHADTSLGSDAVSADSAHHQNGLNSTDHLGNSTSGEHDTDNDAPGKKKKGTKRRKVNHACLYCRRSHMTCDEGRPCQRWCGSPNLLVLTATSVLNVRRAASSARLDTSVTMNGELRRKRRRLPPRPQVPLRIPQSTSRGASLASILSTTMSSQQLSNLPVTDVLAREPTAGQYPSTAMPMTSTWPGMGLGMAQGAWMYPPETLSNEFSVLS